MTAEQSNQIKALFDAAFDLAPEDREQFLRKECNGDFRLFAEVQKLFAANDEAAGFLESPPPITDLSELSLPDNPDAAVDRRIGHYQLIKEIGRGGMARVFLANRADDTFEKQVAIKLISDQVNSEATRNRFLQERNILARLEHPYIARLLDGGTTEGDAPYFVMEFVDGLPINQYCEQYQLNLTARLQLFRQVCEAVQYAHQNLIVHRDLKPSNILVTPEGTPKLLDFGIAKLLETDEASSALTKTQFPFTPEYASPEQVSKQPINTATDIYSLGVLLYELLTGKKPYDLKKLSLSQIAHVISEADPIPPKLDYELDNILQRALRKEPAARYKSVEQFSEDVRRYLAGEPVLARPTSFAYRTGKVLKKNKITVTLAAILLFTLLSVLVTSIRQNFIAKEQARQQRRQLYATQINQALQDWELGNLERMRETLNNWLPQSGQEDLRGFEWNYLWQLRNPQTITFQHAVTADFGGLGFSEQDNFIWGSNQKVFSLWDAKTGQKLNTMDFSNHQNVYMHHLEKDFPMLLADEKMVQMVNLRTGQSLFSFALPNYRAITFEVHRGTIFTGHDDGTVKLWDVPTGKLRSSLRYQDTPVDAIYFTLNWQKIFTRVAPQEWRLRDINQVTYQTIRSETAAALPQGSPDGNYFCFQEEGQAVRVFASTTGRELGRVTVPGEPILHATFTPDSQHLLITSTDSTAKLYRLPSLAQVAIFKSDSDWMHYAEVSPNGKLLMAICGALTVKLWDTVTQKEVAVIKGHEGKVIGAKFSHEGSKLLTWSEDGTARIWEVATLLKPDQLTGHEEGVFSVAFAPDGKTLASASKDHSIKLWDAQTGQALRTLSGHTAWVFAVAFSPNGKTLASGSRDNTLRLWDVATGEELRRFTGHTEPVRSVAFSPDGMRLATASSDATIRVWDIASGRELMKLSGHKGEVYSVAFSSDGTQILSAGADDTARLWDARSGQELLQLRGHTADVWAAKFSPDGHTIATVSADRTIKLWDAKTGRETATIRGHANDIFSLAWSPDGTRLATSGNDKTVRIWNVQLGMEVLTLRNHTEQVWSVAFSPDGKTLASASWDKTIRLWRTNSSK